MGLETESVTECFESELYNGVSCLQSMANGDNQTGQLHIQIILMCIVVFYLLRKWRRGEHIVEIENVWEIKMKLKGVDFNVIIICLYFFRACVCVCACMCVTLARSK